MKGTYSKLSFKTGYVIFHHLPVVTFLHENSSLINLKTSELLLKKKVNHLSFTLAGK